MMYAMMAFPGTGDWLQSIDDTVYTMAVEGQESNLVNIAEALSFIGSLTIMLPFVMILAAYLYWKKRKISMLFWLAGLTVAEMLIWTSKFIYARPRPPMALVTTHGYSFPSGHAGTAAAVAVGPSSKPNRSSVHPRRHLSAFTRRAETPAPGGAVDVHFP